MSSSQIYLKKFKNGKLGCDILLKRVDISYYCTSQRIFNLQLKKLIKNADKWDLFNFTNTIKTDTLLSNLSNFYDFIVLFID